MSIIGVMYQLFSIIVLGDYNPNLVPDGTAEEDSWFYYPAYWIAEHLTKTIG